MEEKEKETEEEREKEKEKEKEVAASDARVVAGGLPQANDEIVETERKSYEKKGFRHGCYKIVKRTFDIVSSGLAIILSSIIVIPCLIVKRLEDVKKPGYRLEIKEISEEARDGGKHKDWITRKDGKIFECKLIPDKDKKTDGGSSPIYTSVRVGKDGKLFKFHKIRSMCPGAEAMKGQLIAAGLNEADEPAFKMKNDPRITKFGKFLRKTSIDELPQLWDIFVGKMSVVGPRSPLPDEVKTYTEKQKHRLDVKGGLLCLWQIRKNRNSLSFDEWVELDLEYIEKQSLCLDMRIIFKGAFMVLFDRSGE